MNVNLVPVLGALLLSIAPAVRAQSQTAGTIPNKPDYKLGQVWTTNQGINVTIIAVDEVRRVGRVVHVRLDNIPWQSCGNVHLTRTIEHLAVTEKMMVKSDLVFSKENVDLPPSSIEAYRKWQGQKKREIAKAPLPAVIQAQAYVQVPMICNLLPSQT